MIFGFELMLRKVMNIWYNVSDNVWYKSKLLIILHNHLDEKRSFELFGMQWFEEKWKPEISYAFYRCLEQHISVMCKPTKTYRN